MSQPTPFERQSATGDVDRRAGFTLIEVLVTLAVAAVCLAAIGSLMAGNIRGSGRIAQHVALIETLRLVETGLPDRASLSTGTLSGDMNGQAWSVNIAPFQGDALSPPAAKVWAPQTIAMTVRSPSGAALQIETIRLVKRTSEP